MAFDDYAAVAPFRLQTAGLRKRKDGRFSPVFGLLKADS
jgi:hypothetical protein